MFGFVPSVIPITLVTEFSKAPSTKEVKNEPCKENDSKHVLVNTSSKGPNNLDYVPAALII